MSPAPKILVNTQVFHEPFLPPTLPERQKQIKELAWCMAPLLSGQRGTNAWLWGPSGSGKTAVVRRVLEDFRQKSAAPTVLINCWDRWTCHGVVDKILTELRVLGVQGRSTAFKLERLERFMASRPLVVVLDEVDRMPPLERNDVLYNLVGSNNTLLICIASAKKPLLLLDERVRSRFNPAVIEFPEYTKEELTAILQNRAESGISADAWAPSVLSGIVARSGGDARTAIQTLRNAARQAEKEGERSILIRHIEGASSLVRDVKKLQALAALTSHHQLLLKIVNTLGEVASGDLWTAYLAACKEQNVLPIAARTFNDYMNTLLRHELVTADWSVVKGRKRVFRPASQAKPSPSDP